MKNVAALLLTATMILGEVLGKSTFVNAAQSYTTSNATLVSFTDESVSSEGLYNSIEITGTDVKITGSGTYVLKGSCSNGTVTVKKGTTGVTIVLDGLDLTSTGTSAPISCNKSTEVEIIANEGTQNHLADTQANLSVAADTTTGTEAVEADDAVIKAKSGSVLTLSGTGALDIDANAKNGIKGASEAVITISEENLTVDAVNNAIASDSKVVVTGGTLNLTAGGDGIKASPDEGDTASLGDVAITGGDITINATEDGVHADNELTISGGTFNVTTNGGYTTKLTSTSASCKAFKGTNSIVVSDGTFVVNSADDAFHSNQYVTVTGGTFNIKTSDDGMHGDTSLIVGTENSSSGPEITIESAYEGLEAGTVYIYSGDINIAASDDGINAAGGSSNGSDSGSGNDNQFNPGGGGPGMQQQENNSSYSIDIYGGDIYINVDGDGIDSNNTINFNGGNIVVFGQKAGGDNEPIDADGTVTINGGTIFGAGSGAMVTTPSSSGKQAYISSKSSSSGGSGRPGGGGFGGFGGGFGGGSSSGTTYSAGKQFSILDSSSNVVFTTVLPKDINYYIYSDANINSSATYTVKTSEPEETTTQSQTTTEKQTTTKQGETTTQSPTTTEKQTTTKQGETTTQSQTTKQGETTTQSQTTKQGETTTQSQTTKQGETTTQSQTTKQGETTTVGEIETTTDAQTETTVTEEQSTESQQATVLTGKVTGVRQEKNSKSAIQLKWTAFEGADGYQIYRKEANGKYKKVATTKKTSYTNKKLTAGTVYTYKVRAYAKINNATKKSSFSKAVTMTTLPKKVTGVKAVSAKKSLTVKWQAVSGSGYIVQYATNKTFTKNSKKVKVASGKKSVKISKLKSGKTYYVRVCAYSKKISNSGAYSKIVKVKVNQSVSVQQEEETDMNAYEHIELDDTAYVRNVLSDLVVKDEPYVSEFTEIIEKLELQKVSDVEAEKLRSTYGFEAYVFVNNNGKEEVVSLLGDNYVLYHENYYMIQNTEENVKTVTDIKNIFNGYGVFAINPDNIVKIENPAKRTSLEDTDKIQAVLDDISELRIKIADDAETEEADKIYGFKALCFTSEDGTQTDVSFQGSGYMKVRGRTYKILNTDEESNKIIEKIFKRIK